MAAKNNFIPPLEVAEAAIKGLELRRKFKRGGTMVGVARARDLKNRRNLSAQTILRMYSYFSRHMIDKRAPNFGNNDKPSAGYIAWLLWGGDAGMAWSYEMREKLKNKTI